MAIEAARARRRSIQAQGLSDESGVLLPVRVT
jgi:hypothetical protein